MINKNKILFFDLDGTIISVENRWYALHCDFALKYNLNTVPREEYIQSKKLGIDEVEILRSVHNSIQDMEAYNADRIKSIENPEYLYLDSLFDNISDVLQMCSENFRLVLVTKRKNTENCMSQLKNLSLDRYFEKYLISPGSKKESIKTHFTSTELKESWLISDASEDLITAQELDMHSIAVGYGCRDTSLLHGFGEKIIVRNTQELFNFIKNTLL